jgi:NADH:ubiquinone oxidoreductase subunit 4 (subunit M)
MGNIIYYRTRTRNIRGVKRRVSLWRVFSVFFLFVFIINFRFPPFINFFREVGLFYVIILVSVFAILLIFVGFLITGVYLLNIYVVMFKSKSREWWNLPSILIVEYIIFVLILILYTEISVFLVIL